MINMMKDIFQYLPYAIFLAAIFALLFGGIIFTVLRFRKADKKLARFPASKTKNSISV